MHAAYGFCMPFVLLVDRVKVAPRGEQCMDWPEWLRRHDGGSGAVRFGWLACSFLTHPHLLLVCSYRLYIQLCRNKFGYIFECE